MISKILATHICKHIAKATQASAPTEALLRLANAGQRNRLFEGPV